MRDRNLPFLKLLGVFFWAKSLFGSGYSTGPLKAFSGIFGAHAPNPLEQFFNANFFWFLLSLFGVTFEIPKSGPILALMSRFKVNAPPKSPQVLAANSADVLLLLN